jgi:hypothetical protein
MGTLNILHLQQGSAHYLILQTTRSLHSAHCLLSKCHSEHLMHFRSCFSMSFTNLKQTCSFKSDILAKMRNCERHSTQSHSKAHRITVIQARWVRLALNCSNRQLAKLQTINSDATPKGDLKLLESICTYWPTVVTQTSLPYDGGM